MASFTPTVAIDDPRTTLGGNDMLPPARDGGDDHPDDGSRDFHARLRRARLGMGVAVAGIVMIFVSFTSAYVVRQGLPTLDPRTGKGYDDFYQLDGETAVLEVPPPPGMPPVLGRRYELIKSR